MKQTRYGKTNASWSHWREFKNSNPEAKKENGGYQKLREKWETDGGQRIQISGQRSNFRKSIVQHSDYS